MHQPSTHPFRHPVPQSALLVIDMNRGHLDRELNFLPLPAEDIARIVSHTVRALDFFRSCELPVVYVTTDSHRAKDGRRLDNTNPFFMHQVSQPVPGVGRRRTVDYIAGRSDIVETVAPLPGEPVVVKRRYSAFNTTDLDLLLRGLGVRHLYLAGVNTNNCVLSHAFDACNRDYGVTVLADCCASMNGPEYHEAALRLVQAALGWVTTVDDLCASADAAAATLAG